MTKQGILPAGHRAVSATLLRARATGRALSRLPTGLPDSLDGAYRLQEYSIADWDDKVAGWKVGGVPQAYRNRFDDAFLAGPIFARSIRAVEHGGRVAMPVFEHGFAAVEPEFVFRLGACESGDRLFIGAEIASSPIPDINDYGPIAVISDFGNNNGLALGPEVSDWRSQDGTATISIHIDGECVAQKSLDDFRAGALTSLAFLRRLAVNRGFDLPEGTLVSSGAITGVHEAASGAEAFLDFSRFGSFEIALVNMDCT